ncbi:transcriptional regulator [Mucilaginibacter boryungensis]|uniref:Transcriptional regulator n=1 Tax=Mucilaginibacter boryungensis TaxID=768480 RepID=A0ABR9XNN0_9SPHI|nr:transcriptional regulator [Mucilaginibacter boryungensis]MBE9668650.1 transcriptional regulator [Mucilaginibacter boryungensis]
MELYSIKHDVKVFCVEAKSFPRGIMEAFDRLNKIVKNMEGRDVFGISKPQNGVIRYRAAASENFDGEGIKLGLSPFSIQKGFYLGETLMNWQQNEMMIMNIFNRLVADKRLDGSAHCIEWYKSPSELLCLALMRTDMVTGDVTELSL